jgi:hypothetical protein
MLLFCSYAHCLVFSVARCVFVLIFSAMTRWCQVCNSIMVVVEHFPVLCTFGHEDWAIMEEFLQKIGLKSM